MLGALKPGHLHPVESLLFRQIFKFFHFHTGEPILITPEGQLSEKGSLPIPKLDETEGFQCLRHSNWTICIPLNPFCSENFATFSLSYWEANSYYPRGPIIRKGKIIQPPKWMRQRGFSAWGIQTGPFAAL